MIIRSAQKQGTQCTLLSDVPSKSLLVLAVSSTYLYYVHVKINLHNLFSRFSDPTTAAHQSVFPVSFKSRELPWHHTPACYIVTEEAKDGGSLLFPLGDHFFEIFVHFRGSTVQTAAVWKLTANNVNKHVNTTKRKGV